jgi:predicted amidohydrolase
VIGAAQCGARYTGHSLVASPYGDTVVRAENDETVLHVSLDLAAVAEAREANPSLANRRL